MAKQLLNQHYFPHPHSPKLPLMVSHKAKDAKFQIICRQFHTRAATAKQPKVRPTHLPAGVQNRCLSVTPALRETAQNLHICPNGTIQINMTKPVKFSHKKYYLSVLKQFTGRDIKGLFPCRMQLRPRESK